MDRGQYNRSDARAHLLYDANKKSVGASYLLWFFLGGLGVHRFYLNRTGSGIAQLLLGLLGWLPLFLGWIVLGIWLIVDAFLIPHIATEENVKIAHRFTTFM